MNVTMENLKETMFNKLIYVSEHMNHDDFTIEAKSQFVQRCSNRIIIYRIKEIIRNYIETT